MKIFALFVITFYRRFVSPWKGFSCAYRVHTGRASCSALGFRAVRRYGARRGLEVSRGRLARCGIAYREHRARQAGHCDIPDVPCDGPDWDCLGSAGDAASCFQVPCDAWSWWGSKTREDAPAGSKRGRIDNREPS